MDASRKALRRALVALTFVVLFCFIAILVIRVIVEGLYQIDIFATDQINSETYLVVALLTGLAVVWLVYRQSFIGVTYTDVQHRALRIQAWFLVACVITAFLLAVTLERSYVLILSILVGLCGYSAIRSRVTLAFRSPVFYRPLNTGIWAVAIGSAEIALAISLLWFFVKSLS